MDIHSMSRARVLHFFVVLTGAAGCGGSSLASNDAGKDGGADVQVADGMASQNEATCPVAPGAEAGTAVVIVSCQGGDQIAVAGTKVFWVGGHLMEAMKDGTLPLILDQGTPAGIAANLTDVYWTEGLAGFGGTVHRVPVGGGPSTLVASGQSVPSDIAVDDTNVYWGNAEGSAVMKEALVGGLPVAIATGTDVTGPSGPRGITLDATNVYWGNSDGTIMTVSKVGGATVTLAQGQDSLQKYVAVDGTSVYWMNPSMGTVMKVPKVGGVPSTLAATRSNSFTGIATDGVNVYWVENGTSGNDGRIMKVGVDGGAPVALGSGLEFPRAIVLDDANVYWGTTHAVMRAPK